MMAEFCLECFNTLNGTAYTEWDTTLEEDFCEGCGQIKPCVIRLCPPSLLGRLQKVFKKNWKKMHTIQHKGSLYKIRREGKLTAIERQPINIQTAYIRVFGAAAAALDVLQPLRANGSLPQIEKACRILQRAIEDTEEHTNLFS